MHVTVFTYTRTSLADIKKKNKITKQLNTHNVPSLKNARARHIGKNERDSPRVLTSPSATSSNNNITVNALCLDYIPDYRILIVNIWESSSRN